LNYFEKSAGFLPAAASVAFALPKGFDVGSTQAASLGYGRELEVHSSASSIEYAYEHPSAPTVLCMSLCKDLKLLSVDRSAIQKAAEAHLAACVESDGKATLQSLHKIYLSDACCIDIESEADTTICQCGHQCINSKNVGDIQLCPMCRGVVDAFIRADGTFV
jgi:hypothetical protein